MLLKDSIRKYREDGTMAENQRFLKHNAAYYENAMLQANNLSIFNQTTL